MSMVFRRDAIQNMRLECNRLDFDIELAGKLIRQAACRLKSTSNMSHGLSMKATKSNFRTGSSDLVCGVLKAPLFPPVSAPEPAG